MENTLERVYVAKRNDLLTADPREYRRMMGLPPEEQPDFMVSIPEVEAHLQRDKVETAIAWKHAEVVGSISADIHSGVLASSRELALKLPKYDPTGELSPDQVNVLMRKFQGDAAADPHAYVNMQAAVANFDHGVEGDLGAAKLSSEIGLYHNGGYQSRLRSEYDKQVESTRGVGTMDAMQVAKAGILRDIASKLDDGYFGDWGIRADALYEDKDRGVLMRAPLPGERGDQPVKLSEKDRAAYAKAVISGPEAVGRLVVEDRGLKFRAGRLAMSVMDWLGTKLESGKYLNPAALMADYLATGKVLVNKKTGTAPGIDAGHNEQGSTTPAAADHDAVVGNNEASSGFPRIPVPPTANRPPLEEKGGVIMEKSGAEYATLAKRKADSSIETKDAKTLDRVVTHAGDSPVYLPNEAMEAAHAQKEADYQKAFRTRALGKDSPQKRAEFMHGRRIAAAESKLAKQRAEATERNDGVIQKLDVFKRAKKEEETKALDDIQARIASGKISREEGAAELDRHMDGFFQAHAGVVAETEQALHQAMEDFADGRMSAQDFNRLYAAAGSEMTGVQDYQRMVAQLERNRRVEETYGKKAQTEDPMLDSSVRIAQEESMAADQLLRKEIGAQAETVEFHRGFQAKTVPEIPKEPLPGESHAEFLIRQDEMRLLAIEARDSMDDTDLGAHLHDGDVTYAEDESKAAAARLKEAIAAVGPQAEAYDAKLTADLMREGYSGPALAAMKQRIKLKALETLPIGYFEKVAHAGGFAAYYSGKLPFVGGFVALAPLVPVLTTVYKIKHNEPVTEDELAELQATLAFMNRPNTWGSGLESIVSEMPGFMVELASTAGIATGVRKLTEEGMKEVVKMVLTKEGRALAKKLVAKHGADLAKYGIEYGQHEALDLAAGIIARKAVRKSLLGRTGTGLLGEGARLIPASLDNIALSFGQRYGTSGVYVEEGEDGTLAAVLDETQAENIGQALKGAVVQSYFANASERLGGFLRYAGLGRALSKTPGWQRAVNLAFVKQLRKLNPTKTLPQLSALMRRSNTGNLLEEYTEERANEVASAIFEGEEYKLPSLEQTTQELVAFAIPGSAHIIADHVQRKVQNSREGDAVDRAAMRREIENYAPARSMNGAVSREEADLPARVEVLAGIAARKPLSEFTEEQLARVGLSRDPMDPKVISQAEAAGGLEGVRPAVTFENGVPIVTEEEIKRIDEKFPKTAEIIRRKQREGREVPREEGAGMPQSRSAAAPQGRVDKAPMSQENPGDGTAAQPTGPAGSGGDATGGNTASAAGTEANTTDADRQFLGRFAAETGSSVAPAHRQAWSPAVEPAEQIAGWLGLRLKWFTGPTRFHAMMDVDTRTAWVNADRPDVTAPSLVLHEAWHQIKKSDPDLAAAVAEHFKRLAREGQVDLPGFAKFLGDNGYKGDEVSVEEMISHVAEEFAYDPKFWDKAFAKNPGLGAKVLAAINKWIEKIAILLQHKEPTITADVHGKFLKTVEAVDTMREQLAKAYAGMAERARTQGSKPQNGSSQAPASKIPFALDMNPNKAVGMAASKVPVVAEPPPVAFSTNVKAAAQVVRHSMEKDRAVVSARGGVMVNLANPDHQRAAWLDTDPMTARVAHALNSASSGYKQPDPAKVRSASLLRNTLVNADFMVHAKDKAGRESPTWIKVYQDGSSPTGELWHFVVTDQNGDFQTQYSAPSIAGTSAEGAVLRAAGERAPRKAKNPPDQKPEEDGEGK